MPISKSFMSVTFLSLFLCVSSCKKEDFSENGSSFPDMSACPCFTESINVVCGTDGNNYLNECFATCMGTTVDTLGNCTDSIQNPLDTASWPILGVCHPVLPSPPIIKTFSDGSLMFLDTATNTHFRGYEIPCLCLPPSTLIATKIGQIKIASLTLGDSIWTKNAIGKLELQPITQLNRVEVPENHQILNLKLKDGRILRLTPEHPNANGKPLASMQVGDTLDGSIILSKKITDYIGTETLDLRPAGATGTYWAEGIHIGSMLLPNMPMYQAIRSLKKAQECP